MTTKKKKVKARNPAGAKRSGTEKGKEAARKGKQAGKEAAKRSKSADKKVASAKSHRRAVADKDINERRTMDKSGKFTGRKKVTQKRSAELDNEGNRASDRVHRAKKKRDATPTFHPPKKKATKKKK